MKVAVFLTDTSPTDGGNFSLTDRLVKAIDQHSFMEPVEFCFIGRSKTTQHFRLPYYQLTSQRVVNIFYYLRRLGLLRIIRLLTRSEWNLALSNDLQVLRRADIDLVFYVRQYQIEVEGFPFVVMNWDLGHKSTYMFPEFIQSIDVRNRWYNEDIHKALGIVVESQASKMELIKFLNVDEKRLDIVPLFPGSVVEIDVSLERQQEVLREMSLMPGDYFLYPAQFWAMKNHYNLLVAFKALVGKDSNRNLKLVLCGADKGNLTYVMETIRLLKLQTSVRIAGFVSVEALRSLYQHAIALVMPTFLGPTNMPLLEAQVIGIPVICSDLEGHREQCGDGAIYVDPLNTDGWTSAMEQMLNPIVRRELLLKAGVVRAASVFNIDEAMRRLDKTMQKLVSVRRTFPPARDPVQSS